VPADDKLNSGSRANNKPIKKSKVYPQAQFFRPALSLFIKQGFERQV
jgi:hypothetical protein